MRYTLLKTAIPGNAHHLMIKDRVLGGVKTGSRHLGRHRHADCVSDSLSERSGGTFYSWSIAKFGVARRLAMQLTKLADFGDRDIKPVERRPSIQKHAA